MTNFLKIILILIVSSSSLPAMSSEFSFEGYWTAMTTEWKGDTQVRYQVKTFIWPKNDSTYVGVVQINEQNCVYHIRQTDSASNSSITFKVETVQLLKNGEQCKIQSMNVDSTFLLNSTFSGRYINTVLTPIKGGLVKTNLEINRTWSIPKNFLDLLEISTKFSHKEASAIAVNANDKANKQELSLNQQARIEQKKLDVEYRIRNEILQAEKLKGRANFPYFSHEVVHETEVVTLYTDAANNCGSQVHEGGGNLLLNAVFNVSNAFEFDHSYLKSHLNASLLNKINASVCHENNTVAGTNTGTIKIDIFVKDTFLVRSEKVTDDGYLITNIRKVKQEPLISFHTLEVTYTVSPGGNKSYTFRPNIYSGTYSLEWLYFIDKPKHNEFMNSVSSINSFIKFSQSTAENLLKGITPEIQFENEKANRKRLVNNKLLKLGVRVEGEILAAYLSGDKSYLEQIYTDGFHFEKTNWKLKKIKKDRNELIRLYILASNHHCGKNTFSPHSSKKVVTYSTKRHNYGQKTGELDIVFTISDYLRSYPNNMVNIWQNKETLLAEMEAVKTEKSSWIVSKEQVAAIKNMNQVFKQTGCSSGASRALEKHLVEGLL